MHGPTVRVLSVRRNQDRDMGAVVEAMAAAARAVVTTIKAVVTTAKVVAKTAAKTVKSAATTATKTVKTRFALELHSEKTRLIEFGRHAAPDRARRNLGKPETFDFLGFTHICGKTRAGGRFKLLRVTMRQRKRAKLREVKDQLQRCRDLPIPVQGMWLRSVLRGHYAYYAVPGNGEALGSFRRQVTHVWLKTLRRRSQRHRLTWTRMNRLVDRWLPAPRILHPYPEVRFAATTRGRSPVR